MNSSTYLALDSKQLLNCIKFSTTYYCESLSLVKNRSEDTCESAIYWNETASLINEEYNFELSFIIRITSSIDIFLYKRKTNFKSYRRLSVYYYKKNTVISVLNKCRTYYLKENILLSVG